MTVTTNKTQDLEWLKEHANKWFNNSTTLRDIKAAQDVYELDSLLSKYDLLLIDYLMGRDDVVDFESEWGRFENIIEESDDKEEINGANEQLADLDRFSDQAQLKLGYHFEYQLLTLDDFCDIAEMATKQIAEM